MAFSQTRGEPTIHQVEWFELFGRLGVTAIGYPIEYVKVLIQIGHEPLPPRPTRTLMGRPALALPGVFTYMKHIKKVDGFTGLYRGLMPKLCTNLLSGFTYRLVIERISNLSPDELNNNKPDSELTNEQKISIFAHGLTKENEHEDKHVCLRLPNLDVDEKPDSELTNEQKISIFARGLMKETAARCVQIIVSHPFQIITIRTMAQFVGREETYGGLFGSVKEILQQEGIPGFFSGLVPRMMGDIFVLWLGASTAFFINNFIVEEEALKGYVRSSMAYLASALFYPFAVVSNVVIVNNCGLKAGIPPNMPIYTNWRDCWSHLSAIGQLKRGASILWRYYSGPYMQSALGSSGSRKVHAQALIPSFKSNDLYSVVDVVFLILF